MIFLKNNFQIVCSTEESIMILDINKLKVIFYIDSYHLSNFIFFIIFIKHFIIIFYFLNKDTITKMELSYDNNYLVTTSLDDSV